VNGVRERFWQALAFFTRLPVPRWVPAPSGSARAGAAGLGPLVGWLVGGWAALVYALGVTFLPPAVAVVLALAASTWVTGALHEDGLADFCDGFGAGGDRERVLAIMADSRSGVYGVLGVVLIVLLRYATLNAIADGGGTALVVVSLIAGHALSRFLCVSFMHTQVYVRPDPHAKGRRLSAPMDRATLALAMLLGVLPLGLFWIPGLPLAMLALAPALLVRAWLGRLFTRRLGGYTGDCLGAAQQLTLGAFYLGVSAAFG